MKILSVLLTLMVLLLNTLPCCWEECSEEIAVEHTQKDTESTDACSPFLSCGSCTGFVLQQDFHEISYFSAPFRRLDAQKEIKFKSDYSSEIWLPPKKV